MYHCVYIVGFSSTVSPLSLCVCVCSQMLYFSGQYQWLKSPDEYINQWMELVNLESGTTYQVRVVAKNGEQQEAAAPWIEVTTQGQRKFHSEICHGHTRTKLGFSTFQDYPNLYTLNKQIKFVFLNFSCL